jgi:hypothetical protein
MQLFARQGHGLLGGLLALRQDRLGQIRVVKAPGLDDEVESSSG